MAGSRLAGRATGNPFGGVGSADPRNQAQAGAADPKAAAELASKSPAEIRAAAQRQLEESEKISRLRGRIVSAYLDAGEDLPSSILNQLGMPGDVKDLERFLEGMSTTALVAVEQKISEHEKQEVDDSTDDLQQSLLGQIGIGPDDLAYQYIFDKNLKRKTEDKLEEIDFASMVFDGFAEQEVKLRKGFSVVFRTIGTTHGLWLERRLHEANKMSEQYGRHWFSLLQLAVTIQSVNGRAIGGDLNSFQSEGAEQEQFWESVSSRLNFLGRMPTEVTDLLIANMALFSTRVKKTVIGDLTEKVGNS